MEPGPPMSPSVPLVPIGALATAAVIGVATWRRLRRLEDRLDPPRSGHRSAREVLEEHLALAAQGDLETDIARSYRPDVALLTSFGTYRGHQGLRALARRMDDLAPDATFEYHVLHVDGDVGFLRWSGHGADGSRLLDGADSYLVRDGWIVAQTIHYRTESPEGDGA